MAKLPDNFVKSPAQPKAKTRKKTLKTASTTAPKAARRPRKKLGLEAARAMAHEILVRLSPEEHRALTTACDELRAAGEHDVTEEIVVRRALAYWLAERNAPAPEPAQAPQVRDGVIAELMRFAKAPIERWRRRFLRFAADWV